MSKGRLAFLKNTSTVFVPRLKVMLGKGATVFMSDLWKLINTLSLIKAKKNIYLGLQFPECPPCFL